MDFDIKISGNLKARDMFQAIQAVKAMTHRLERGCFVSICEPGGERTVVADKPGMADMDEILALFEPGGAG